MMKLDAHVHTLHSGRSSIRPLGSILNESYTPPDEAYRIAKARGMDLVAITDHNSIDGAMSIADRADVIVGCEVSAGFPGSTVEAHIGVLDITPRQFKEIEIRRANITRLLPYLRREGIFSVLNHPASQVNGRMTVDQIAAIVPWVNAVEGVNGSRTRSQNRTARGIAVAAGKTTVGGSDAHTVRGIGRAYTVVEGVYSRKEFMAALHIGLGRAAGHDGDYFTMASDIVGCAAGFYRSWCRQALQRPFSWPRVGAATASLGLAPVVPLALLVAVGHFQLEGRFNRALERRLSEASDVRSLVPDSN